MPRSIPEDKKPTVSRQSPSPRLSLKVAQRSWFVHGGTTYAVADCPVQVFKQVIKKAPRAHAWGQREGVAELLREKELDIYSRWYLLCECPIQLFGSRDEAEESLAVKQQ